MKLLLCGNQLPGLVTPIDPGDLACLAFEDAALSCLVRHDRERDAWTVRHGPFREEKFPGLGDRDWTLLVQDVDKWDADIAALLPKFDFLPRWRIHDVMVSFAPTGGSRSDARRVGTACDNTCRSRWSPSLLKKHQHT